VPIAPYNIYTDVHEAVDGGGEDEDGDEEEDDDGGEEGFEGAEAVAGAMHT
jgi:hypothetical protein